jgi:cytochrome c
MKKILLAVPFAAALAFSVSAMAADGNALLAQHGCNGCHSGAIKTIPTFKQIAAKCNEAKIIDAINKGSKGVWGTMPMSPIAGVSAADAKAIAAAVLAKK